MFIFNFMTKTAQVIVLLIVVVFLAWQVRVFLREPRARSFSPIEIRALEKAGAGVADTIAAQLEGPLRFGVAHLKQDANDAGTQTLKQILSRHPEWDVHETSLIRKFLADVSKAVMQATSVDEVLHAARKVELDVLILGRVVSVAEQEDGGTAVLQISAYDLRRAEWLFREATFSAVSGSPEEADRGSGRTWRWLAWIAFVALLPWTTPALTRWAVEGKSNWVSLALIAGYTGADLIAAFLFAGLRTTNWTQAVLTSILAAACTAYNLWVCQWIAGEH